MPTTTPPAADIGQIWTFDDTVAIITGLDGGVAHLTEVVAGSLGTTVHRIADPRIDWTYSMQTPTLKCISAAAATAAAEHLAGHGVTVYAAGEHVIAPMTPTSVLRFAEEALDNGWAHDEDCARMIGHLG